MLVDGSRNGMRAKSMQQTIVDDGAGGIIMGKGAASAHNALLRAALDVHRCPRPGVGFESSAIEPPSASFC